MAYNNGNQYNEPVGLLKTGTIKGYDPNTGKIQVELNYNSSISNNTPIEILAPHSLFYNNGIFIGTLPSNGTPVVVAQGSGLEWHFVSFRAENINYVPELTLEQLLLTNNGTNKITLGPNADIFIGTEDNRIHLDTDDSLFSVNFKDENHFTQASRQVNGRIRRDLRINKKISQSLKLESDEYQSQYYVISMDNSASPSIASGASKNPAFVEQREIVYEFEYYADIADDLFESSLYSDHNPPPSNYDFINRRKSRSDTLSLTLTAPNYLMETIKGTVVDIFGNILDLNRVPLPIGKDQYTIKNTDKVQSFLNIKEIERKSIAFHFELNAKKDLSGNNTSVTNSNIKALLDIDSNVDYARNRSRFFIDIDKEGQFKINVPASSEKGNIPLLARYENYSTFGSDNPNKLEYRDDNLDIFLDSFSAPNVARNSNTTIPLDSSNRGSITIMNGDAVATPEDRITGKPIKHGTVYHDILNTCYVHSSLGFISYQNETKGDKGRNIDVESITDSNNSEYEADLNNIATNVIKVAGNDANAGGRSGSINLDGSLEFNIGANTIDRQSLWLDTAGGIIGNIGRDLKNRSVAANLDGDVFIQIGGVGISTDNRFTGPNSPTNAYRGAVFDIRILNEGYTATMLRIDKNGIQILCPSNIQIHASQNMKITSDADIHIECENLMLQGRMVIKGDPDSGTPSI